MLDYCDLFDRTPYYSYDIEVFRFGSYGMTTTGVDTKSFTCKK